jgi:Helicase HerA, central domain
MNAIATSADGRSIVFEAPVGAPLAPGGFAVVETNPPLLAQVTACELVVRDAGGRRAHVLEGTATALGESPGGFSDLPIASAPPEAVAAWAAERFDPDGLDVGALVHAPGVRARLDARGLARHTFLCGQSGSGKTYTTGVLLEQIVRQTDLRLIVLDPNSDHIGLREARDDADPAVAELHRARAAALHVARAHEGLPFATAPIGMRFSNFGDADKVLVLRLDLVADSAEVEALLDAASSLQAPYDPLDVAAAATATGSEAGRRLAARIRALGIVDWDIWQRDPAQRVLGDLARTGEGIVVDTGSIPDPAERSAVAAAVLTGIWGQRAARIPTLVVLDEAHHICPAEPTDPIQAVATEHAVLIAGEGRKYGIFLLVATQRPQKVHPSVVAGCESLVLLRMNSLRDVRELEAAFSHVPEGLLRLAPGFARGEALVGGALAPAPLHLRIGGRITPEGGGDVPATWARPPQQTPADAG